ncbi:MAG: hypothetical protein NTV29_04520 [Planctomycetota bacterium]|nr:hypothetical protein [Planctomycetota bacterium]
MSGVRFGAHGKIAQRHRLAGGWEWVEATAERPWDMRQTTMRSGLHVRELDTMRRISSLVWLLSLLVLIAGCRGCTSDANSDKLTDQEKQKRKLRLVADELRTLPFSKEIVGNSVKSGHWYQTRQKLKANQNDESLTASLYEVDRNDLPTSLWPQGLALQFERDVSVAKGQEKTIEMKVLQTDVPFPEQTAGTFPLNNQLSIFTRYAQRGLGSPLLDERFLLKLLKEYQYDMLVLSRDVSRQVFWRGLDCVVWPQYEPDMKFKVMPHRIIDISEEEMTDAIPSQLLTMTSVSHMVLNDVSLNILPQDQQDAILDWLHFGGTIIINGPDAIAGVETSFLKPYAPIQNTSSGELSPEQLLMLNDRDSWCLRYHGTDQAVPLRPNKPIPILLGQVESPSAWIENLEGLVAERLVGQGRIVMTCFPMNDSAFVNWPSYSALIHNAVLRKPARDVKIDSDLENPRKLVYQVDVFEKDGSGSKERRSAQEFERSSNFNTRLRLWARDLDLTTSKRGPDAFKPMEEVAGAKSSSFGAWNANALVGKAADGYLKKLSGITVPNLNTILKWLLAYLIVLVPLNWLFFRLIRRLELAWIAAPLIAIAGVFVIAKAVQLDVGFSRSETSVALVEMHNNHPRAVLSSFHALYSSLTTNYQIVYPEGQGVVSPMPQHRQRSVTARGKLLSYRIADSKGAGFQAFPVLSNTTGLVQSEEVIALGGAVAWTIDPSGSAYQVSNGSDHALRDVILLGFTSTGELKRADIGTINAGDAAEGQTQSPPGSTAFSWTTTETDPDRMKLQALVEEILANYPLQREEWIALGWTDAELSKLQIAPMTPQRRSNTLLLMHAQTGSLGSIEHDLRLIPPLPKESDEL